MRRKRKWKRKRKRRKVGETERVSPFIISSCGGGGARRPFLHHARVLEHVGPLAAGAGMAVLEVLAEVVGAVELLARVALAELVHALEVPHAVFPVLVARHRPVRALARPGELLAAVAAHVGLAGPCRALVERPLPAGQGRTGPAMSPDVERVLMSLCLILVLEAVAAE